MWLSARPTFTHIIETYMQSTTHALASIAQWAIRFRSRHLIHGPSSPEVLGSPTGYVVLPGHRLLRPHPKLSFPPVGLFSSSGRVLALRSRIGWKREAPQFTPRVFSIVPPPAPRRSDWLQIAIPSPIALAFATFTKAQQTHSAHVDSRAGHVTRLHQVHFRYGPMDCLPFTDKDFYFRACA